MTGRGEVTDRNPIMTKALQQDGSKSRSRHGLPNSSVVKELTKIGPNKHALPLSRLSRLLLSTHLSKILGERIVTMTKPGAFIGSRVNIKQSSSWSMIIPCIPVTASICRKTGLSIGSLVVSK